MLDTIIVPSRPIDSEICELTSDSYAINETLDSVPFQVSRDKFFDKPASIIVATMMSSLGKTRLSNADEAALLVQDFGYPTAIIATNLDVLCPRITINNIVFSR